MVDLGGVLAADRGDDDAGNQPEPPAPVEDNGTGGSVLPTEGSAQPLDDGGIGHAAALTHRLQPVPPAVLLEGVGVCIRLNVTNFNRQE
jgi:hypothetical protein